jgi:hypothetical protein
MSNEIKIEVSKTPAVAKTAAECEEKVVTWQFKKRQYQEITNIIDKISEKTRTGNDRKVVIRARNWRLDLDLSDPLKKKMHEYLLRRKDINHEFYLLTDKIKTDRVSEEGATLQKLMDMSIPQLMNCITTDELNQAGLIEGRVDRFQLIAAIMRKKKLA